MSVRRFHLPAHPRMGRGWCRWCGDEILKTDGTPDNRRTWHGPCLREYFLHSDTSTQRAFLIERDGERCANCGSVPGKWRRFGIARNLGGGAYEAIRWVVELDVEHIIPLWATTQLNHLERIKYFGPTNLQLLCRACHSAKSVQESSGRAKVKRLAGETGQQPTKRPIRSRGFGKQSRPIPKRQHPWSKPISPNR